MAAKQQANTVSNNYHSLRGTVKMSAYQPIDIKPLYGRKWVTNELIILISKRTKMLTMIHQQMQVLSMRFKLRLW
jgi:hypothetical protein